MSAIAALANTMRFLLISTQSLIEALGERMGPMIMFNERAKVFFFLNKLEKNKVLTFCIAQAAVRMTWFPCQDLSHLWKSWQLQPDVLLLAQLAQEKQILHRSLCVLHITRNALHLLLSSPVGFSQLHAQAEHSSSNLPNETHQTGHKSHQWMRAAGMQTGYLVHRLCSVL